MAPPDEVDQFGGVEAAYEAMVIGMPLWWSKDGDQQACDALPKATTSPKLIIDHILSFHYRSVIYVSAQGWWYEHAAYQGWRMYAPIPPKLAKHVKYRELLEQAPLPPGVPRPVYDPEPMVDLDRWLRTGARRIIFVDGANDLFAAERPEIVQEHDMRRFVGGQTGHELTTADLSPPDRRDLTGLIRRWTGIVLD